MALITLNIQDETDNQTCYKKKDSILQTGNQDLYINGAYIGFYKFTNASLGNLFTTALGKTITKWGNLNFSAAYINFQLKTAARQEGGWKCAISPTLIENVTTDTIVFPNDAIVSDITEIPDTQQGAEVYLDITSIFKKLNDSSAFKPSTTDWYLYIMNTIDTATSSSNSTRIQRKSLYNSSLDVYATYQEDKYVCYYDDSTWKNCTPYYYNGTEWIKCEAQYFDGTNWK